LASIQEEIIQIVRAQAHLDTDPDPSANLISEAGIDSLMALRILASIEKTFNVRIPDDQLKDMTSVENIASFIEKNKTS
jgi:acyl carrier protein